MSAPLRALFALLPLLPAAYGLTPTARWGHQAVYVKSQQAMYVIGGQVQDPGTQVTNDVLVLPLNGSNPSWQAGPSTNLPPHAFAAVSVAPDGHNLMVIGGMTSSCATDSLTHTLDLNSGSSGSWVDANPSGLVRRRGAAVATINDFSSYGKVMLVGGIADQYSCASSTNTFPAADVLNLPLSTTSVVSTRNLPGNLTGPSLSVSDFALTSSPDGDKMYLVGGQDNSGNLVGLNTIGVWTKDGGWTSQTVGGNIPVGRVGATLVAHPTLDVLVLHGGARDNRGSDLSTSLLALLNTTSWQWTIPANLQPPQSSATSYHSAVMTPSGVMITAFGMSNTGAPRSDMYYLDMRDPSGSAWSWKSAWSSGMMAAYTAPSDSSGTGSTVAPGTASSGGAPDSKRITSIVVPVVIVLVLAIPVAIYFIRRKIRIARKRRMARHFSFSSQEDQGDFRSPLTQFMSKRRWTMTQYSFGRDANEKEEQSLLAGARANVISLVDRLRGRGAGAEREMQEVHGEGKRGKVGEKSMRWEEIDFGLGQVDSSRRNSSSNSPGAAAAIDASSRRSSFSATGSPPGGRFTDAMPMPVPMASGITYRPLQAPVYNTAGQDVGPLIVTLPDTSPSPRVGTPVWDGQQPLIPSLVVMPPTVPPTPAQPQDHLVQAQQHVLPPGAAPPASGDGLDWNMLQQELEAKPAFRSISPTSPLRSHQASHQQQPLPRIITTPPSSSGHGHSQSRAASPFSDRHAVSTSPSPKSSSVRYIPPSVDFPSPSPSNGRPESPSTITLVNPKTGRRTSVETLPLSPGSQVTPRSVSSPITGTPTGGRVLAGNFNRRGSLPQVHPSSGNVPPSPSSAASSAASTPTVHTAYRFDPHQAPHAGVRRGSVPHAGHALAPSPQIVTSPTRERGAEAMAGSLNGRRGSQLRVCNRSDEEDGHAL